ncbi:MAG: nucleotidyltransferase substrate binding protein [Desulfobulbaceae bacterium]|nr:nucleotidyltransferase substrate binding protein [Desulfobulbaceae bacterium]
MATLREFCQGFSASARGDGSGTSQAERNGFILRFELTLKLAWKTLKNFLEEQGFSFKPSPKDTIRLARLHEDFADSDRPGRVDNC